MKHQNIPAVVDYTTDAAEHLRQHLQLRHKLAIGSSHAHMLVAASQGYASRKAMLDDKFDGCKSGDEIQEVMKANPDWHPLANQWMGKHAVDEAKIAQAIDRMRGTPLQKTPRLVHEIGQIIQDGLTPPCAFTGIRSRTNEPLGNVQPEDSASEWVNIRANPMDREGNVLFTTCRCCPSNVYYRPEDLDRNRLCSEHQGEFDMDEHEAEDYESLIEYFQKVD